jgi:hypothetical protein
MEAAIEAGADDVETTEQYHEVKTSPEGFPAVKAHLESKGLPIAIAEISMIPSTEVSLDARKADQMVKLMEALEDHDDVQNVWANFDFAEARRPSRSRPDPEPWRPVSGFRLRAGTPARELRGLAPSCEPLRGLHSLHWRGLFAKPAGGRLGRDRVAPEHPPRQASHACVLMRRPPAAPAFETSRGW